MESEDVLGNGLLVEVSATVHRDSIETQFKERSRDLGRKAGVAEGGEGGDWEGVDERHFKKYRNYSIVCQKTYGPFRRDGVSFLDGVGRKVSFYCLQGEN